MISQPELFGAIEKEQAPARTLLDQLLTDSRLYTKSKHYQQLLDFVVRLRNSAPFNAMLLQLQKSGLRFAASANDWRNRFGRTPIEGARPLLILWPFGPVALVYDVLDTDGRELPRDVMSAFPAKGEVAAMMNSFRGRVQRKGIEWGWLDAGDGRAGYIRLLSRASNEKEANRYLMLVNRNHAPAVQVTTLTHELAHLFLGHLGADKKLHISARTGCDHAQREIEAESVAYIVCGRNGVSVASETYLSKFVQENTTLDQIDVYQVMRAAGQVETLLGLNVSQQIERQNL